MNKKWLWVWVLGLVFCLASGVRADKLNDLDQLSAPPAPAPSIPQIKTPTIKSSGIPADAYTDITDTPTQPAAKPWGWQQPKQPAYRAATISSETAIAESKPSLPDIPTTGLGAMKGPADIKKPKISVPSYQNKYDQTMKARMMAQAEMKKQMKLFDRIMNEIGNYGIWIIVGLVLFIIIYTIWKEKETDSKMAQEEENIKQLGTAEKKDIWSDGF